LKNDTEFTPTWSNIEYWYPAEILEVLKKYWAGQKNLEQDLYALIIQAALVRVSKQFSYAEHKTPKLFKSKFKKEFMANLLTKNWKAELDHTITSISIDILNAINQFIVQTKKTTQEILYFGGVDSANFQPDINIQIDCVITSPPYLQAQEYIRTVKMDLYWLGYDENQVKGISKLEIPYRKADSIIETQTLNEIRNVLKVKKLIDVLDSYFCYTIKALERSTQNLKREGYACIFVGNPKVDGIEVQTWKIIHEYFADKGFTLKAIYEDKIKTRQLFGSRNNKNPEGMKSEYLLVLQK